MPLLDVAELRSLENLRLAPRRSFAGATRGERLTTRRGISIDFSDYRNYAEGDDLRHVDWNVLARLEQAVTKTYRDEEDLCVHLLLDTSPSMDFGEPTKFAIAAKLAWALGYIALCGGDTLYARALGSREAPTAAMRGRASMHRFESWLASAAPQPGFKLVDALERFMRSNARKGIALLVSDGLDPDLPQALVGLGARGHDVMFLQVLSDLDLDPDLEGDLRLLDSEGAAPVEITANTFALNEYRKRLAAHLEALETAAQRTGGRRLLVTNKETFRTTMTDGFKRNGWVRS